MQIVCDETNVMNNVLVKRTKQMRACVRNGCFARMMR